MQGRNADGQWKTTAQSGYPSDLCKALAKAYLTHRSGLACDALCVSPVFCSQDPLLLLLLFDFFSHALFRAAGYWYRRPTFIFIRISRDEIFNAFSQPHYLTLNKMLQEAIKPNEFKFLKKLYSVINDHTLKQKIRLTIKNNLMIFQLRCK